jgi:predicted dehydrogenase
MRDLTDLRAAVVGTGFIGVVHVDALRRLGVQVLGVVGSSPERARARSGPVPDFPTFADGHRANVLGDVVAASARERRWVEVPA